MHLFGNGDGLLKLSLPQARLIRSARELPVADRRGVGERAGEVDFCAEAGGLKMVQFPAVLGQQAQFGHDSVDDEPFGRAVGRNQWQDQAAVVKLQGVNVEAQAAQRGGIQSDVRLAQ